MPVTVRPSAAVAKVLPAEDLTLRFAVENAPADGAVNAFVLSDTGGMALTGLESFHQIRVPFTEAELAEFPPFPASIRERARREGHLEFVSSVRSGGDPIPVAAGETVVATVEISAVKKGVPLISGQLVLEGQNWGRNEVPIAALLGRGAIDVVPVPAQIVVNIVPGELRERDVTIFKAPVEATVVAVLDTGSPHVRFARLMASGTEQRFFTDEELLELPPALRERARREGYPVSIPLGTVGQGEPIVVPRGGMLQAFVTLDAPAGAAVDLGGTLTIESTAWRRIEVPISPVVGDVKVSLSGDRVTVRQGEGTGQLIAHLESVAGPDTEVHFGQWFPESRWTISPKSVPLAAGATLDVTLNFAAPATTPAGSYRLDLRTTWFDERGDLTFQLNLTVEPARVTVTPLQLRLTSQQGGRVSCPVEIRSSGAKIVRFSAGLLPHGVSMPTPAQIGFSPGAHVLNLDFIIDRFALPDPDHRATVNWQTSDGITGTLELRFTIQLRPEEKIFEQAIVTENGVALRGGVKLVVRNDGTGVYSGHMRATGAVSYNFRIRSVIHSADREMLVVGQESGSVHGTFDFGDQEYAWSRPVEAFTARLRWAPILNGTMIVNNAFQIGGLFGTLKDLVGDTIQYITTRGLLGSAPGGQLISTIVFIGSELGDLAGLHNIAGPGGIPGVLLASGAAFVVGPSWVIPVFVGTAVAGELTIKHRALSAREVAFCDQVFAGSLDYSRIRITNLTGAKNKQFTCPSSNDVVLVNMGDALFDDPISFGDEVYKTPGQLLIHELVHAWQIQHRSSSVEFLWDVLMQKLGADGDYSYGPPGPTWSDAFGLEAQASVVDEWFAGVNRRAVSPVTDRKPINVNDPYFRYIRDNIRASQT